MKYDILLFNPPQTKSYIVLSNLALLWIASFLKRNGVRVRVFYLDHKFKATVRKAISDYKPKYAAVSCKWYADLYGATLVAKEIRKLDKEITIIAGGITASYFDEELLRNSDFDMVVRGDAELPLLNVIKDRAPINRTVKDRGAIQRNKLEYIQEHRDIKGHRLVEPSAIMENPGEVLSRVNFIWTGKGCTQNCFYCAGSSSVQKQVFGRSGLFYRPVRDVLADIAVLSKYSKYLMFDFACPPHADGYYLRLFKGVPQGELVLTFFHWGIPSKKLVDRMSASFKAVSLHFDTTTLCEELRGSLSGRNLLKPFFSNGELEDIISYCVKKRNITIVLDNIAGLPSERVSHVKKHTDFARYLAQKYPIIEFISYMPLSAEPGSILQKHYKRFNMNCCRNGFMDFLNLSRRAFNSNIAYPFSRFFSRRNRTSHPYGLYERGFSEKSNWAKVVNFEKIMEKVYLTNKVMHHRRSASEIHTCKAS